MILYIIKSMGCLALLLFFYHSILEKEKMHNFNRFYLLGSILFSFLVPLATITIVSPTEIPAETSAVIPTYEVPTLIENTAPIILKEAFDYTQVLKGIYLLISIIFLFRFGRNLFKILQKISLNKKVKYENAILVLVEDNILPHTFWKYIFISKKDYFNEKIEEELFTHELTHVTEKHTIDVLLIELFQIVFWINPIFIFLKKAVQLNHEFIADETVIHQHKNTSQYQHLLLNKATWNNEYYLASNLNYSLTKKRLLMMTTQSSHTKILLKKLMIIPLLASFIFLFAERVEAHKAKKTGKNTTKVIETSKKNSFIFPIEQKFNPKISSKFGIRKHPILKIRKMHKGIDIVADEKANILSVKNGKVIDISENDIAYGKFVVIKHKNGLRSFYAHMNSINVKKGQIVKTGEKIGVIGNSGRSINRHLHFEILKNQKNVNPLDFIKFKNSPTKDLEITKTISNIESKFDLSKYQKTYNLYEIERNKKPHFVNSSKERQYDLTDSFSLLGTLYYKLSKNNKKKAKRPIYPYHPYVRLMKNNKVFYKLPAKLTEADKLLIPPPPPPPNSTKQEILIAKKAYKKWKNRTGNDYMIPPPPPPKNHLDQVIKMAKKGAKFYYEGKSINSDKAIELLKKNKKLNIHSESTNYSNYKVWISKTPIKN